MVEMRMPSKYIETSPLEMEYDGGFSWGAFGKLTVAVGLYIGGIVAAATGSYWLAGAQFVGGTQLLLWELHSDEGINLSPGSGSDPSGP